MPFTLAHAAAALPFRRLRLVTSALVIGTFAPDFQYFLRLTPDRRFGHTLLGTFVFTLPVAILVLWLFHAVVKRPATSLMPYGIRARLSPYLGEFRFGGPARFALILASLLLGIATHLFWDSFTHGNTWAYWRWEWLREPVYFPMHGVVAHHTVLQHLSTVIGIAIVVIWLVFWYRRTEPQGEPVGELLTRKRRVAIVAAITVIAFAAAMVRALVGTEFLTVPLADSMFAGEAVTTFVALLWWQLVVYGLLAL
jgi:Domain of unknown function (DUF4184)